MAVAWERTYDKLLLARVHVVVGARRKNEHVAWPKEENAARRHPVQLRPIDEPSVQGLGAFGAVAFRHFARHPKPGESDDGGGYGVVAAVVAVVG